MRKKRNLIEILFFCMLSITFQGCNSSNRKDINEGSDSSMLESVETDIDNFSSESSKSNQEDKSNYNSKTEYNKEIYSSEYVTVVCNVIYNDKVEFSITNKLENSNITSIIETVALDGKVPSEEYNENRCMDIEPLSTAKSEFGADIKYTDHHYITTCIEIFNDDGSEIENINVINFDLGNNANDECKEPNGIQVFDSSNIGISYIGADEKGIRLRINNKIGKNVLISFDRLFAINEKEYDETISAKTLPAESYSDYYFVVSDFEPNYNPEEVESFKCTGSISDGEEIESFNIDSRIDVSGDKAENIKDVDNQINNVVYDAYLEASNLTKNDLSKNQYGRYEYKGLCFAADDNKWVDDSLNKDGTVEYGSLYRSIATSLEGFYESEMLYSNWGKTIVPLVFGIDKPDTWDECKQYIDNASSFIKNEDSAIALLKRIEQLQCVDGKFDFNNRHFNFTINDLSMAANEMGISETMLGYSLAMLEELAPTTEFDGNTYSFSL